MLSQRQNRRGSIVVVVAFVMIIVLIGVVFAVDVAYVHSARTEIKAVCDLSTLAAVEALTRTQNTGQAEHAAKELAQLHTVAGQQFKLKNEDITFGRHSLGPGGTYEFNPGSQPYTAIQITGSLASGAANSPIQSVFGSVFGIESFEVSRVSTGVQMDRDIALVLDLSTSMSGGGGDDDDDDDGDSRFDAMIDAAHAFVDEIALTNETERVMIVSYNSTATNHLALTESTVAMRAAIDALAITVSGTAIGEGLQRATNDLHSDPSKRPLAQQVIILMTDGAHNTGVAPADVVGTAAARHHLVNTITFGPDANQTDMQQIADTGHGIHVHAPGNNDLMTVFAQMAQSVEAQLTD